MFPFPLYSGMKILHTREKFHIFPHATISFIGILCDRSIQSSEELGGRR